MNKLLVFILLTVSAISVASEAEEVYLYTEGFTYSEVLEMKCLRAYYVSKNPGRMAVCEIWKQKQAEAGHTKWCDPVLNQKDFNDKKYLTECAWKREQVLPKILKRMPE